MQKTPFLVRARVHIVQEKYHENTYMFKHKKETEEKV